MYERFAQIYDKFMQDIPYEKWLLRINEWIKAYGISKPLPLPRKDFSPGLSPAELCLSEKNLVLELGCGTGTMTEMLYRLGYDMIGIDSSSEMLNIAISKKETSGSNILYLCQKMQEMELYSTVGTIILICDSLNYLLTSADIEKTLRLVHNYLYPGGIFIFDFNTKYKYEQVIGDATIAESDEDCAFIWENYYHAAKCLNEYDLTFFIKEESGYFARYQETHYQKGYELEQIKGFLNEAGLEFIKAIDDETEACPNEKSERIFVIAQKIK